MKTVINMLRNEGDVNKLINVICYELYDAQEVIEEYFMGNFNVDEITTNMFIDALGELFDNYREIADNLVDVESDDDTLFEEIQDDSYEGEFYG